MDGNRHERDSPSEKESGFAEVLRGNLVRYVEYLGFRGDGEDHPLTYCNVLVFQPEV